MKTNSMKKQKLWLLLSCTFVLVSGIISGIFWLQPDGNMNDVQTSDRQVEIVSAIDASVKWGSVAVDGTTFRVEIADTDARRQRGLMWRESMPADQGMLFVFETVSSHSFWMKNTLLSLDMVWLDAELNVVDIQTVEPCPVQASYCPSYVPAAPAKYVLEVNAYGFQGQVGDKLVVEF